MKEWLEYLIIIFRSPWYRAALLFNVSLMFCVCVCSEKWRQSEAVTRVDLVHYSCNCGRFVQQALRVEKAVLCDQGTGPCKLGACLLHELSDNTTSSLLQWLA